MKQTIKWVRLLPLTLLLICGGIYAAVFFLYRLPVEAAIYPTALCAMLLFGVGLWWAKKSRAKHRALTYLAALPDDLTERLQEFDGRLDRDYRAIIDALACREAAERESHRLALEDRMDYYTTWAHQIKTPIASMRLALEKEDTALSRQLREELFRVEQYVEMVLTYQRLDSESTDYVFRECDADTVIRGALRKFASQFIGRGIRLNYEPCTGKVITDEKWLSFVLEQVLSNALKYTRDGSITVSFREGILEIRDTGIGIAPEDLPRIFEKGYTGYNGRTDKKASGLGLYLCRRICDGLGHGIFVDSQPGVGTAVRLDLRQTRQRFE